MAKSQKSGRKMAKVFSRGHPCMSFFAFDREANKYAHLHDLNNEPNAVFCFLLHYLCADYWSWFRIHGSALCARSMQMIPCCAFLERFLRNVFIGVKFFCSCAPPGHADAIHPLGKLGTFHCCPFHEQLFLQDSSAGGGGVLSKPTLHLVRLILWNLENRSGRLGCLHGGIEFVVVVLYYASLVLECSKQGFFYN